MGGVTGSDLELAPRSVLDSRAETIHIVLPGETNALGTLFGGTVMQWIDIIGGVSASRHARGVAVTAAVDALQFIRPIHLGNMVVMKSQVNMAWNSSMEVGVRVEVENPRTGERHLTTRAYLTFVAIDEQGQPRRIAPLRADSDDERRRMQDAITRREARLRMRKAE